jgi:hypothetical protein
MKHLSERMMIVMALVLMLSATLIGTLMAAAGQLP